MEITSEITELVGNLGLGLWGSIIVIIFFIVKYILNTESGKEFLDKIIKKIFTKAENNIAENNITLSSVENHEIFKYIDLWLTNKIPTLQFSTEYRTLVFRKYLTIYLVKYKENLKQYISDTKFKDMDSNEIWTSFFDVLNKTIYEYETEMYKTGLPSIVIERMKIKNNESLLLTIDLIEGISLSDFYNSKDNLLKVYSNLNILLAILQSTISNSEPTCNSINGSMQGFTFDGAMEPYHD